MDTEPSSDQHRARPAHPAHPARPWAGVQGWGRAHRGTIRVLLQVIVIGTGVLGLWLLGVGPQSNDLPPPTPAALSFAPSRAVLPSAVVHTPVHSAIKPEPDVLDADAAQVLSLTVDAAPTVSMREEAGLQEAGGQEAGPQEAGGQEAGPQEAEARGVGDQDVAAPAGGEALLLSPSVEASLEASGEGAPGLTAQPLSSILSGVFASILPTPAPSPTVLAAPDRTGQWVWPVRGELSQGYSDAHRAIDISAEQGSVVVAADAGTVVYARWGIAGYGYLVIVDHHNGFVSYYGHLYGFYVDAGYTVARGEQIGELGTTGRSTGPHLHFEIRQDGVPRNPLDLLP